MVKLKLKFGQLRLRRASGFLITIALLTIIVGVVNFHQGRKKFTSPVDVLADDYSQNPKLEKHFGQAEVLCPKNEGEGFCDAPCWNGAPYQEPNFVVSPNCTEYSSKDLLIYVYTSLGNFKERASIREQFKNYKKYSSKISASLMFVVGLPSDNLPVRNRAVFAKAVQTDHKTHGDILQIDIPDTYINLGFKGIAAFKWVSQCGESTKYIAKIDDDASHILDVNGLFMAVNKMETTKKETENRMVCLAVMYNIAAHEPKPKISYEVSFEHYFERRFPPYCFGNCGIFMNRQVALSLYKAAKDKPVFRIDDIYITGLLRQRACIPLVDWNGFSRFMNQVFYKVLQYISGSYQFLSKDYQRYEQAIEADANKKGH